MITHERLVETVATEAQLNRSEEATHVARTVLADLSLRLGMPDRRRLQRALPAADRDAAYATVPTRTGGAVEFFHDIGEHLGTPPERARYLARTVLSTLRASDPELVDDIGGHLPPDIAELFAEAEPDPARQHPATPAPAPLTVEEVNEALRIRPDWSGDTRRLERTVTLPADRVQPLLRRVKLNTRDLGHRFDYRVAGGTITFVLYTRSVGAVTEPDLRLADAIDATVNAFGSGG
ncbi:DUF2267 domain-containing protein [Streptomyces gobiensis]|uniref:DUF2267 domain-containing protein n=1 Tax=Streptomyces gobiensis TaxID=2875706 RepID=UPI001E39B7C6|nr:DUF2267 domain-containing protein [Streptomyces gobiensis]UGY90531.1 DUF2267 domain-containing protein [Streptomyces gobiensis]